MASKPARSFLLRRDARTASVLAAHEDRCAASRHAVSDLALDAVVTGREERTVWALYLQVLRELAHHPGREAVSEALETFLAEKR